MSRMAFGEEYGDSMGEGVCERCGSTSKLRGIQKADTSIVVCHATCAKCHFIRFIGFTSTEAIAHELVKKKLIEMRNKTTNPVRRQLLDQKLVQLESRKRLNDLNL